MAFCASIRRIFKTMKTGKLLGKARDLLGEIEHSSQIDIDHLTHMLFSEELILHQ